MAYCSLSRLFQSRTQREPNLQNPARIVIRSQAYQDEETWRSAIISCDTTSDDNIISHELVTKVLCASIQSIDKECQGPLRTQRYGESINGYVDLAWCLKNNEHRTHKTRFFVTTSNNPPYDAVLGRRDAEQYGISKPRNKR
ncbi:hypothetical protein P153DRAFT_141031 [Dothidotthia symphoricarpi CBS 119687]|uniref:Uncharacterized protein n=1 Tax=Dothidotthia symphoricarpi CBS 119687 TaxID=1392245 RepID=A0A6A5ZZQ3_9PLEO|nr:uncharacterized protein P153DRAFT_141031 [Dothidotthia symphoricarpi CBS 119687]KAF2123918.1 hypothetical protein P153DRAFT_141031 [Dothidotthia symphoricarpi CBS 119687]